MTVTPAPGEGSGPSSDEPRTLADELRSWDDDALAHLLELRPDLMTPVPSDVTALTTRAATRASVARALERLDTPSLRVLDAIAAQEDAPDVAHVASLLGLDDAAAFDGVESLRRRALVWGPDGALRLVRTVRELLPGPAELGPPAASALVAVAPDRLAQVAAALGLEPAGDPTEAVEQVAAALGDPQRIDAVLHEGGEPTRLLAADLASGPAVRQVPDARRAVAAQSATGAVGWLLAHGLLIPIDDSTVVIPREVGLHLRGGRLYPEVALAPPVVATTPRRPDLVEHTAAGQSFAAVRAVESLLEAWGIDPPSVLRAGGLGVRELRRAATLLEVDEPAAALWAELAYSAGLLGSSGASTNVGSSGVGGENVWLPTPAFDSWQAGDLAEQWLTLVTAWLDTTRLASLAGTRDDRDKAVASLGPDLDRAFAPVLRRGVLGELALLPPGSSAAAAGIATRLRWWRPRQVPRQLDELVEATLREAEQLGLTGLGALSGVGRRLVAGDVDAAAAELAARVPEPVDHVMLQADLTAVAPGPLTRELARELRLVADVESTGGATVYRFTETSVRRALDAGRSAGDVHALLDTHSRTPVPQPLRYLVDDVARRHGRIRVGVASCYIRCDDDALLSELMARRQVDELRLRRLAPTVIAAQAPVDVVLERLRAVGYAPAAEGADGDVVVRRPDSRRTPPRQRPPRVVAEPAPAGPTLRAAAVRAIRAGDRAASVRRRPVTGETAAGYSASEGELPRGATAQTLAALSAAVGDEASLWIGYVDGRGSASQRVVEPIRVERGYLTAYDHRDDAVRSFAVHRITGVARVD